MSHASRSSNNPLAAIAGIESRNENLAAVARFSPARSPPMIVEPERLAPGISESTCARPTTIASLIPKWPMSFRRLLKSSAIPKPSATAIIMVAITQRFFVPSPSISSLYIRPTTPIGIDPIMTSQPSQASCESHIGRTPCVPENVLRPRCLEITAQ
jgi:hypothetical protein